MVVADKMMKKLCLILNIPNQMQIVGNFEECKVCKLIIDTFSSEEIKLCSRCKHLYVGEDCGCWSCMLMHYKHKRGE